MMIQRTLNTLSRPDYSLMRKVNRWRPPRLIRWWMIGATRAGDGWLWALWALLLLASSDPWRSAAVMAGSLATLVSIVVFRLIKNAVGRKRPCHIEPHCWATLLPPDQFSFPSGHSMTSSAVAVTIGYFYPGALAALLFCACSIAVSRILLGMHFLSDVVVGALLGIAIGYGAVTLVLLAR